MCIFQLFYGGVKRTVPVCPILRDGLSEPVVNGQTLGIWGGGPDLGGGFNLTLVYRRASVPQHI